MSGSAESGHCSGSSQEEVVSMRRKVYLSMYTSALNNTVKNLHTKKQQHFFIVYKLQDKLREIKTIRHTSSQDTLWQKHNIHNIHNIT